MKTNNNLTMPSNFSVLSEEEMMNNNSGWYVNVAQKKVILLANDITTFGTEYVNKFLAKIGIENANIDLSKFFDSSNENSANGLSITFADKSFTVNFDLSEEDLELAAKNKFSLF